MECFQSSMKCQKMEITRLEKTPEYERILKRDPQKNSVTIIRIIDITFSYSTPTIK